MVFELNIDIFLEADVSAGSGIPFDLLTGDEGGGGLKGVFEKLAKGKGAAVDVLLGGSEYPISSSWAAGGGHFGGW